MPQNSKTTHKTTGLAEKTKPDTREDVAISRAEPSSYLAKTQRPNLQDRERHVIEGHARGLTMESLIRNSGYPVRTIYALINRDPLENMDEFNRLVAFKSNLLNHKA
jgi:hypothetical protein